jgi:hypothetical protein
MQVQTVQGYDLRDFGGPIRDNDKHCAKTREALREMYAHLILQR